MKSTYLILSIALLAVGCNTDKDKDTARDNLTRTWQISKVYTNGDDVTASYLIGLEDYRLSFDSDGDFVETYYPFSGAVQETVVGTWEFANGTSRILLFDDSGSRVYDITRLDSEHLNVIERNSGDASELQLIPA